MVAAAAVLLLILGSEAPALAERHPLHSPTRLSQMPSGHLLVSEGWVGLKVWDPRRQESVRPIDIAGRVVGVAFGWNRLFLGNEVTSTVEVYNLGGRFLYTLGGENDHVARPTDIALDIEKGLVFVSDPGGKRVLVFDRSGPLLRTLPAPGQPPLYKPTGIAVDPERGQVLVSDFGKPGWSKMVAWVKTYDYNGQYLGGIRGDRNDGYGFSRPQGLALNGQGLLYMVDSYLGKVLVFDRDTGEGVATIGALGTSSGFLKLPLDAWIDQRNGNLYVTNNLNKRVEVFEGKGFYP